MKELEFIEIIKRTLSKSSYIGDDCAHLEELGIVITQDNLVEDIHFSQKYSTPYQIAYKAIMVNLSDIFASGATPKYLTISLSLSKYIDNEFIKEFYQACEDLSKKHEFEVVGGDITGSEKIFISICAIGLTKNRKISSRKNAKVGDYIITTGVHGSSAAGRFLLQNSIRHPELISGAHKQSNLINKHLKPTACKELSEEIATQSNSDYAMMDTSDGLVDALFKIGQSSNVLMTVDFDKIPYDEEIKEVAKEANLDYKDWVFYGGEDFQLVACVSDETLNKLDKTLYTIIGQVKHKDESHVVEINLVDKIEKITDLEKTYNHFRGIMKISAIITAGGSSQRFGDTNKLLEKVNSKEVIRHTVEKFINISEIDEIIICANPSIIKELNEIFTGKDKIRIIEGGNTRQQSVYNGLLALNSCDFVLIHDGARPMILPETIKKAIAMVQDKKALTVAAKTTDTIKQVDENLKIIKTIDRSALYNTQTPQAFDYKLIKDAHEKLAGQNFTDDAGMLESLGQDVYILEGDYKNIKITTQSDIEIASAYLK